MFSDKVEQAVFFPIPGKAEHTSHPVRAYKNSSPLQRTDLGVYTRLCARQLPSIIIIDASVPRLELRRWHRI